MSNILSNRLGGLIFYSTASGGFYAATIGNNRRLEIYKCPSIASCAPVGSTFAPIFPNTWYFLVFQIKLSYSIVSLRADLYSTSTGGPLASVEYTDNTPLLVDTVGFIVWNRVGGQLTGYFDEAVLSKTDPRFVCVQNLPNGWRMEVWNYGTQLDATTTTPYACVQVFAGSPNFYSTILREGVIRVYDQANRLRASYPPSGSGIIIGGQIYKITSPPLQAFVRILDIVNGDNKPYYGILSLDTYSQSDFSEIQISLCNPSICSSQAISIPPPPDQTSEVVLLAGSVSYVSLGPLSYEAGASAQINLYLNYSTVPGQDGVVVSYPIVIILT